MEAAYEEMSAKECEKMLNLKKPDEARQFFAKKGWVVDNRKMIRFQDLASEIRQSSTACSYSSIDRYPLLFIT